MNDIEKLIKTVIECAKGIRRQLGPGFLENVYKNAMIIELRKQHHCLTQGRHVPQIKTVVIHTYSCFY